jgi:hypothetical protein
VTGGSKPEARAWIDVFSGRPAPEWTLTPAETDGLLSLLETLSPQVGGPPPPAGLGYRGVVVTIRSGAGLSTLRASGGVVAPDQGGGASLADPGREVERYLWESARRHVAPDVIEAIEPHADLDG